MFRMMPRGVAKNQMARSWGEGLQNYVDRSPPSADTPYWDPQTRERYALDENPPEGQLPNRTVTIPNYPDYREDDIIRRREEIPDLDTTRTKRFQRADGQGTVEEDAGIDDGIWHDTTRGTIKPEKMYEAGTTQNYQPIVSKQEPNYKAEPWVKKDQNPYWGKAPPMPVPRNKMGF
jgi:hypothetical protein